MSTDSIAQVTQVSRRVAESTAVSNAGPARQPVAGKNIAPQGKDVPPKAEKDEATRSGNLAQAVNDINGHIQNLQRDLQFSIDDDSGQTVIKVIDSESKEVIRQIPPEEVLAMADRMADMHEGLILQVQV